ncbi:hypothetical protein LDENG_00290370, partial [Lucifuga dentata]
MINPGLIKLSAALLCVVGVTEGNVVTQTSTLWKDVNKSATLNCTHTFDATYYQMYWYRQRTGERMKQIVFTTAIPPFDYERDFSKDKFPVKRPNERTGTLTVEQLLPEDAG